MPAALHAYVNKLMASPVPPGQIPWDLPIHPVDGLRREPVLQQLLGEIQDPFIGVDVFPGPGFFAAGKRAYTDSSMASAPTKLCSGFSHLAIQKSAIAPVKKTEITVAAPQLPRRRSPSRKIVPLTTAKPLR